MSYFTCKLLTRIKKYRIIMNLEKLNDLVFELKNHTAYIKINRPPNNFFDAELMNVDQSYFIPKANIFVREQISPDHL